MAPRHSGSSTPSPSGDLVTRARRIITAQVAATVTLLVLLAGAAAFIVMTRSQSASDQRQLAMMADRPMPAHLPMHAWEFLVTKGVVSGTRGAPRPFPVRAAVAAVAARRVTIVAGYRFQGVDYLVRTQAVGGSVVQAVLDTSAQSAQRRELAAAFAFFEVIGLAAAVVTGRLLSRRAVAPLGLVMERQSRFVADASHELRTPLTQLHTRAQLLQRRLSRDSSLTLTQAELDGILAHTRQFGEVIEDVLRSAQAAHEPLAREPVDLAVVVAEVAAAESARAEAAGVSIAVAGSRPADTPATQVSGIAPALRRAVAALVDNALAHTASGGHVGLCVSAGPQTVQVSVRDDGDGFPDADRERIFSRAGRADGGNGNGQRFGIGLALVREIVENHGGTISASGAPGRGAVFTISLPTAGRASSGRGQRISARGQVPSGRSRWSSARGQGRARRPRRQPF
jgi:two-component system, OmpR family, sensor kinase